MANTVKNNVPSGVSVSADKLMDVVLNKTISEKDTTIGALKQTIEHLRTENTRLETNLTNAEANKQVIADDQKVIVVNEYDKNKKVCPQCGYANESRRSRCWECSSSIKDTKKGAGEIIEYRNLDKVIEDIRKEESKNLKIDNVELEKQLQETQFKLEKTKNAFNKADKDHSQELTDAKRDVRERYQKELDDQERQLTKEIEENNKKINELIEEIKKLEENKTDAEVEEARKQEIVDLKTQITELESVIEEAKTVATPRMKRFWQKIAARSEQRKLEEEKTAKQNRMQEISNQYPRKALEQKTPWWKKGKYAESVESSPKWSWLPF